MLEKYLLNKNWKFKADNIIGNLDKKAAQKIKKWLPAEIPGTVHTDLMNNKIISDPFYSDNEKNLQWISECGWIYKTIFNFPDEFGTQDKTFLVFEGVDTISEIFLNGKFIGKTENMFLKYQFDVSNDLKDKFNELEVKIISPILYSNKGELKIGKLPVALNSSRVYIRKAQYSFGWDWGPSFPTSGIWRNVYLVQRKDASIENVFFRTEELSQTSARVKISFDVQSENENLLARINLSGKSFSYSKNIKLSSDASVNHEILIENPELWFPNGLGEQNLYDLQIIISNSIGDVVDQISQKVGIRKIELVLKESDENTFHFRVNGRKIFARGFNWIPSDSFLPRVTSKKYDKLLNLAKSSGANIIRVWGGGIYEDEYFYETCDKLGLLVWQDFMFACGAYPEHPDFLESVKEEITQNVMRLRNHPCIIIYCGNNENEWIWYQTTHKNYQEMPGYKIYHEIIPDLLNKLDPLRPYWPSSPFGFDEDPNSHISGNRHEWGIWSRWIDYTEVKNDKSLFVTEFGFQGPANRKTIEACLSKSNCRIHDPIFEMHNKQVEGPERVLRFLSAHLPITSNWKNYFYLTQLNQGLALKTCVEHWRNNFPITNGTIIWQLNDCWPVTSWAVIDSELKPKMAYFFVKNIFLNTIITFNEENQKLVVNVINNSKKIFLGRILLIKIKTDSGFIKKLINEEISIHSDSKISIINLPHDELNRASNELLVASLYSSEDELIFRNYYTAAKLKYLKIAQPKIKLKISMEEGRLYLIIRTDKPVYFMDLYHPRLTFSDRGFILLPSEEKKVQVEGKVSRNFNLADLEVYHLNKFLT